MCIYVYDLQKKNFEVCSVGKELVKSCPFQWVFVGVPELKLKALLIQVFISSFLFV